MLPGDGDVGDPDLALVAAPDLDRRALLGRDEVQAPLLLVLLPVAQTLQQDVRLVGLADGHHLHVLVLEPNQLREGEFADLALKLGEVVGGCNALQLLLDLAVDPGLEAADVDESAGALALAGRDQRIVFRFLVAEAHLAVVLAGLDGLVVLYLVLADLEDTVGLLEVVGVSER